MGQLTAAVVAELMDRPDDRGRIRPVVQFVMDWNRAENRLNLVSDPPQSVNPDTLVLLAAVVHALCDRDQITVPAWVHQHRSTKPVTFNNVDIDSDFGRLIVAASPAVAVEHGAYFEADLLQA